MSDQRYQTCPLVLRAESPGDAMNEILDQIGVGAGDEIAADPENGIRYQELFGVAPDLVIHYVEDDLTDDYAVFVTSSPDTARQADELASVFTDQLEHWTLDELARAIDDASDPREFAAALARAALGAPPVAHEALFRRFQAGLRHSDPEVRNTAVFLTSRIGWPEFRLDLAEIAAGDESPALRERARTILQAYDAIGLGPR
ncbi:hypothetical protein [Catenuloplanes indicus]|uniref:HEAT repeat domain-containing protein n=1 Tax=Catenuloplanes indicus TaxID=137267 RepID=A0AAE3VUS0_9ACTN|nr:hypothetical protein [Catenuloplanes indicus]MDQ0364106.1 hypothetical protein [Catenuloplanes indicus]